MRNRGVGLEGEVANEFVKRDLREVRWYPAQRERILVSMDTGEGFLQEYAEGPIGPGSPTRLRSLVALIEHERDSSSWIACRCASIAELLDGRCYDYATIHLHDVRRYSWEAIYVCAETGRGFLYDYPRGHLQSGGPPRLRPLTTVKSDRQRSAEVELELGADRVARVWIQHLPDARYSPTELLEDEIRAPESRVQTLRRAAVEFHQLHRQRSYIYGLLGAEFKPDASGRLRVEVGYLERGGTPIPWSLADSTHDTRTGITHREDAKAALGGVMMAEELPALGSGVLRFDVAAHGDGGPRPVVFQWLPRVIVRLLASGVEEVSPQELRHYFLCVPPIGTGYPL